jgi:hypothetical protein
MSLRQLELSPSGIGQGEAWIFREGQLREMSGYNDARKYMTVITERPDYMNRHKESTSSPAFRVLLRAPYFLRRLYHY